MKVRVVAKEDLVLRSGKLLEKGQVTFVDLDEAATLVSKNLAADRAQGECRSAALLPDRPNLSADKCRQ